MACESSIELFRHALVTLAYRGRKSFDGAPETFSTFRVAPGSRSAGEILAHISDLLDWALIMAKEKHVWREVAPQAWAQDVERFSAAVSALDAFIGSNAPLQAPIEKLLQGPVADALTHVGQIAMMRRLADSPIEFENYYRATMNIR